MGTLPLGSYGLDCILYMGCSRHWHLSQARSKARPSQHGRRNAAFTTQSSRLSASTKPTLA
jgi:hypothetical protein